MVYHGQVVGVPPEMARLVMAEIERGLHVMVKSRGGKRHGVAKEGEVEVHTSVNLYLADIISHHCHVACDIEVQALALRLAKLRAHGNAVFVPRRGANGIGQHIVAERVRGKDLGASLYPFVESFEQGYGEGVAKVPVACLVVDGITRKPFFHLVGVEIIVLWSGISLVYASVCGKVGSVDETCHRHILVFKPRRVLFSLVACRQEAVGHVLAVNFHPARRDGGRVGRSRLGGHFGIVGTTGI